MEKQRWAESERRREDQRRERVRRKKMQVREKGRKVKSRDSLCFFQWFVTPDRKVGSLKRRVRSHLARWEMKNCTPLWREAHLEVKSVKKLTGVGAFWTLRCRKSLRRCGAKHIWKSKVLKTDGFGALLEVEMLKKCAVVAFRSQNVQSTPRSEHFWKLRCSKSVHRCGAKHISKSKALTTNGFGALLDVQMSFCVASTRDSAPDLQVC